MTPSKTKTPGTITPREIEDFVKSSSDFAFEMRVLSRLNNLGFVCMHSGTYQDPVKNVFRQFDIRAVQVRKENFKLSLAVECKNFRAPLLISAVGRAEKESFLDRVRFVPDQLHTALRVERYTGTLYKTALWVGKQSEQLRRQQQSGELTSNDEETFGKLNQAVNSCVDLLQESVNPEPPFLRVILPVLVVPKDALWQVDYAADGTTIRGPRQVERSNLFLDRALSITAPYLGTKLSYRLSHLEIVTFDALPDAIDEYFAQGLFS
jgi:hypothetical protein